MLCKKKSHKGIKYKMKSIYYTHYIDKNLSSNGTQNWIMDGVLHNLKTYSDGEIIVNDTPNRVNDLP